MATTRPTPGGLDIPYADKFAAQEHTGTDGRRLPYRLLTPKRLASGQRYPLVTFLHGAGERGDDNVAQLRNGVAEWLGSDEAQARYPAFVLVPQCPEGEYWAGAGDTINPVAQLVLGAIRSLLTHHPVDPDRLYLGGLSMGGFGAWHLLGREPELFAAGVIICGGGPPTLARRLVHLPLWFFHGAEDDVVPPEHSRLLVAALQHLGAAVRYTEYPGVAHASWRPALHDPDLQEWLFAQRRG